MVVLKTVIICYVTCVLLQISHPLESNHHESANFCLILICENWPLDGYLTPLGCEVLIKTHIVYEVVIIFNTIIYKKITQ